MTHLMGHGLFAEAFESFATNMLTRCVCKWKILNPSTSVVRTVMTMSKVGRLYLGRISTVIC